MPQLDIEKLQEREEKLEKCGLPQENVLFNNTPEKLSRNIVHFN